MVFFLQPTSDEKVTFKKRNDFDSADGYANYVKYAVDVGMIVRCCREYENIDVGCEGKVIKIMRDGGLHDLNIKVFLNLYILYISLYPKLKYSNIINILLIHL